MWLGQINFHLLRPATSFFLKIIEEHIAFGITLLDSGRLHAGLD